MNPSILDIIGDFAFVALLQLTEEDNYDHQKIVAIIDQLQFEKVGNALLQPGITGFTLCEVKGRGNYFDSFNRGHLTSHLQIIIYTRDEVIMQFAHTGVDSEGLASIEPLDAIYSIDKQCMLDESHFQFHEAL